MVKDFTCLVGVDGGGTGTRVKIIHPDGALIARGMAGPSGLAHGIAPAWQAVLAAIDHAFAAIRIQRPALGRMAIGLGLAGVHNPVFAAQFRAQDPGFGALALASDGYITLLGAHDGKPGAIIAIGTGTIGEVLDTDGRHREVSGWGFPAGDEGSGAWLGLRAVAHAQRMLDGRDAPSGLGHAVVAACGGSRDSLLAWLGGATQTVFASLAPLVVAQAVQENDAVARSLLQASAAEMDHIARALDPSASLPVSLCGGLGVTIRPLLSPALQERLVEPADDAAGGALRLLHRHLES